MYGSGMAGEKNDDLTLSILGASSGPPHEGESGIGVVLHTTRGDIPAILHQAAASDRAVLWVGGASGGYTGPAGGIFVTLAEELEREGITSLRLNYRRPGVFPESVMDAMGGLSFLDRLGYHRVVLVGHSFGGAVVIAAAPFSPVAKAVVSLSPQTFGAQNAANLSPRPLILVHGEADTRLAARCSETIYQWAREPKELVLYPGAEHGLRECRDQLHDLLLRWIPEKLVE